MAGTVVIYGGSGGIGSALARILCSRGVKLHLVARNEEKLRAVAGEVNAGYTVGDIRQAEIFGRVMKEVDDICDGLAYAAGTINLASVRRFTQKDYLEDFTINAVGAALAVQAALPFMKKSDSGPSVLFFSSVAAVQGFTFHSSVSMAKGAVNGLTLSLAAELAPKIRVNAVAPSLTKTPLASGMLKNEKTAAAIAAAHALPRLGAAEDIAETAAFLMSPQASWITGQVVSVDGGRSSLRTAGG